MAKFTGEEICPNAYLALTGSPALVGYSMAEGYCLGEVFHSWKDVTMSLNEEKVV